MREEDYRAIEALLRGRGLNVSESRYYPDSFGSWYIYVDAATKLGLVWDGREGRLSVRRQVGDRWEDLWTGGQAQEQGPEKAVDTLFEFVR